MDPYFQKIEQETSSRATPAFAGIFEVEQSPSSREIEFSGGNQRKPKSQYHLYDAVYYQLLILCIVLKSVGWGSYWYLIHPDSSNQSKTCTCLPPCKSTIIIISLLCGRYLLRITFIRAAKIEVQWRSRGSSRCRLEGVQLNPSFSSRPYIFALWNSKFVRERFRRPSSQPAVPLSFDDLRIANEL